MKIIEKVKSFEDACGVLGVSTELPDLSSIQDEKIKKSTEAFIKLCTITKALNEGWEPDWTDHSQYKYFPWFYMDNAGLVCAGTYHAVTDASANIGSRLGFKTDELADYAKDQFRDLYIDLLF